MIINKVQIDNYRNLKHIDIEMHNIVTLIGENNSGKSNFLRAISIPLTKDDSGLIKGFLGMMSIKKRKIIIMSF